jgi:hypothetical protein
MSEHRPWEARSYIGDGVYATFDGSNIWLITEREDGPHRIALEPAVLASLVDYVSRLREHFPGRKLEAWEAIAQAVARNTEEEGGTT